MLNWFRFRCWAAFPPLLLGAAVRLTVPVCPPYSGKSGLHSGNDINEQLLRMRAPSWLIRSWGRSQLASVRNVSGDGTASRVLLGQGVRQAFPVGGRIGIAPRLKCGHS